MRGQKHRCADKIIDMQTKQDTGMQTLPHAHTHTHIHTQWLEQLNLEVVSKKPAPNVGTQLKAKTRCYHSSRGTKHQEQPSCSIVLMFCSISVPFSQNYLTVVGNRHENGEMVAQWTGVLKWNDFEAIGDCPNGSACYYSCIATTPCLIPPSHH